MSSGAPRSRWPSPPASHPSRSSPSRSRCSSRACSPPSSAPRASPPSSPSPGGGASRTRCRRRWPLCSPTTGTSSLRPIPRSSRAPGTWRTWSCTSGSRCSSASSRHPPRGGRPGWPTSRPRCGTWRRWSRAVSPPRRCSRRSPTRSAGSSVPIDAPRPAGARRHSVTVGAWGRTGDHIPLGMRLEPGRQSVSSLVAQTGRPARMDSYDDLVGPIADGAGPWASARRWAARSSSTDACGALVVASSKADAPLPADTESRISAFTELVATAISNAEARAEVRGSRTSRPRCGAWRRSSRASRRRRGLRRGRRGGGTAPGRRRT